MTPRSQTRLTLVACALSAALAGHAVASSHREAPSIAGTPRVDATDFYLFNSYETGRDAYVTLIADYVPLQDPAGGPNFFTLDPNAIYEIHVDNNGDALEDITFRFAFKNNLKGIALPIAGKQIAIPLVAAGGVSTPKDANLNVNETFTLDVIRGDRRSGTKQSITNAYGGSATFDKPVDNIGTKTIADYDSYAAKHVYTVTIPGCNAPGRVFVGQRKDPFAVNLGVIFDLVNAPLSVITDPSLIDAAPDSLVQKNVTTMAIEVPKACLVAGGDPVIGGWTTASVRQGALRDSVPKKGHGMAEVSGGAFVQVSRLGNPLVNEVVVGLPDKDRFNASKPKDDLQFLDYVTNPTLPKLLEAVFPGTTIAPTNAGRNDLVTVYLTGIKGVNQPATVTASEQLRLNTSIPAVPFANQNRLGLVGNLLANGSDNAGFPNGRRPKDDIVDISLVAVAGGLCVANGDGDKLNFGAACKPSAVPLGTTAYALHDAVDQATRPLTSVFPYLASPLPGAR